MGRIVAPCSAADRMRARDPVSSGVCSGKANASHADTLVARDATRDYDHAVKRITQRELRNASAAIMDAVAAGERFCVTRRGAPVAELRPIGHGACVPRRDAKAALGQLPGGDLEQLRQDADTVFGEDRLDD